MHICALRLLISDYESTFESLFTKNSEIAIHTENLQKLMIEIYKSLHHESTVAHKYHGRTFFLTAKLFFSQQNFLSHGKTLFLTAKLSFSRQNFLSHGKNFLSHGKTLFLTAKLSFFTAKLSFTRQNSFSWQNALL